MIPMIEDDWVVIVPFTSPDEGLTAYLAWEAGMTGRSIEVRNDDVRIDIARSDDGTTVHRYLVRAHLVHGDGGHVEAS